MPDIDNLSIYISANANNANRSLGSLINKLGALSTALSTINTSGLDSLSTGVRNLGGAMNSLSSNATNVDVFKTLASNIKRLGNIQPQTLTQAGSALNSLAQSLNSISHIQLGDSSTRITELAKAMSSLGGASATRAVTTIPLITSAMQNMITTLASAPKVSRNVIDLANAMANLSNSSRGVRTHTAEIAPSVHRMGLAFKASRPHVTSLAAAFGKFYASCFLAIRAVKQLWNAIESSMNYVEVLNYFNAAMEQIVDKADLSKWEELGYESAQAYADSFSEAILSMSAKMTGYTQNATGMLTQIQGAKSLGINATDLMNASTGFAQIASSMGVASDNAIKMSRVLTELGADLASVKNLEFEDVWKNLQSAVVGMSRAVDRYGINIRNANLQQTLTNIGIETTIDKLGQEEKAMLRVIEILRSTKFAYGDLADTIQQPANQVRMLKSATENLGRALGNIFLPIVANIIPYLITFANALERLCEYIVTLLGFEDFEWGTASKAGLDDVIGDINDADDALDDGTASANKFKKALQGFDELNNITTKDNSGRGSGGLTPEELLALQKAFDEAIAEYQKRWDEAFDHMADTYNSFADNLAEAFKTSGLYGVGKYLADALKKALQKIDWNKAYKGADSFGIGLANFLNGLIRPDLFAQLGVTIASALNTSLHTAFSFASTFNWKQLGDSLASGVNNFFTTYDFALLGKTMTTFAVGLLNTVIEFLKKTDWYRVGQAIGDWLANLDWVSIVSKVAIAIYEALSGAMEIYVGVLSKSPVGGALGTAIGGLLLAGNWNNITTSLNTATASVIKFGSAGKKAFKLMGTSLLNVVDGIKLSKAGFTGMAKMSFNNVSNSLSTMTKVLGSAVVGFAEFFAVKDGFQSLIDGSKSVVASLTEITVAIGVAAVAFTALMGFPAGLIATACVAVVGAFVGVKKAIDQIITEQDAKVYGERIHKAFLNPDGVPLEDVVSKYDELAIAIVEPFQAIIDKAEGLNSSRQSVDNYAISIDSIGRAVTIGAYTVDEKVEEIASAFNSLLTESKSIFEQEYDVIIAGLTAPMIASLEAAGLSVDAIVELLRGTKDSYVEDIDAISDAMASLDAQYANGEIPADEYWSKIFELSAQLSELTGDLSTGEQAVIDFNDALGNINLEKLFESDGSVDIEYLEKILDNVGSSYTDAFNTIETGYAEIQKALDDYIIQAQKAGYDTTPLEEYSKALEIDKDNAIGELDKAAVDISDAINDTIAHKIPQMIEEYALKYEGFNWFDKYIYNTKGITNGADYAKEQISNFEEAITDVSNAIEEKYQSLGIDGAGWASDAVKEIINGMLIPSQVTQYGEVTYKINSVIGNIVSDAIDGAKASVTKDGENIMNGIAVGISEGKGTVIDEMSKSMSELEDQGIREVWDINSPSVVAEEDAIFVMEGFENGIVSKKSSLIETMTSVMKSVANACIDVVNDLITKINDALQFDFKADGDISAKFGVNGSLIPRYATGGFPPEDGLFYVNHNEMVGKFSNGRTAVANNEQITQGIAKAVYDAIVTANAERGDTTVNVVLEGDMDGVFTAMQDRSSRWRKATNSEPF